MSVATCMNLTYFAAVQSIIHGREAVPGLFTIVAK